MFLLCRSKNFDRVYIAYKKMSKNIKNDYYVSDSTECPKPFWVMPQISLSMTLISQLHLEGILRPKKISEPDYRTFSVD